MGQLAANDREPPARSEYTFSRRGFFRTAVVGGVAAVAGGADDSYSGAHLYDGRPRPDGNLQCTEAEGLLMRYGGEFGAAGRSPSAPKLRYS